MELRFYQDPETGQAHIHNHGVMEEEVQQVLTQPGEDRPGADNSRTAIGQTEAGRYLRVIYVPDADSNSLFIVTAYELTIKQMKAYRRRRRKKTK